MHYPITISLSPNTEKDDVFLALKLLFSPWQWKRGEYIEKLEKEFAKYLGVKHATSFNSGRTAQLAILKSLRLGKGDQVLLQAFTCVVVPNSVLWIGAKPVYVDIEKNTFNINPNNLKKKINSSSRAIIVQHTFGQPAEMEKILKIAKKNNLIVIEDCAHSLGAKYKGQLTGTFGKASFFSFGRDKVISSVFGGMAVTNDDVLGEGLKSFQKNLQSPSYFWIFQQLLHPLIFNLLVLPFYNFFGVGKIILFLLQKANLLSFPVEKKERLAKKPSIHPAKLPHALVILAYHQFKKLDRFNKKRLEIADHYQQELKKLPISLPKIDDGSIVFRYPIKTKKALKLYQFAKKRGVLLGNWYANVIDPKGVNFDKIGYEKGTCSTAEQVAKQVINLPTHPRMREKDVFRVIEIIKEYFRKI
ncbi:DegT/DnrJ/EryC1/StrS family aminotransferase [Candidatus Microgenomates bacterium]|nr:DegT/DnrJ/EryC1/StrS family aminotransferase [Candidatus Microgenomates bacterium]